MQFIIRFFLVLVRGLSYVAPFLTSAVPIFIGAGAAIYGLWSFGYSIVLSNIDSVIALFDTAIESIQSFSSSFVSSDIAQTISYTCAIDKFLTVSFSVVGFVFLLFSAIFVGLVAVVVGFTVKILIAKVWSNIASTVSKVGMGGDSL